MSLASFILKHSESLTEVDGFVRQLLFPEDVLMQLFALCEDESVRKVVLGRIAYHKSPEQAQFLLGVIDSDQPADLRWYAFDAYYRNQATIEDLPFLKKTALDRAEHIDFRITGWLAISDLSQFASCARDRDRAKRWLTKFEADPQFYADLPPIIKCFHPLDPDFGG